LLSALERCFHHLSEAVLSSHSRHALLLFV
jgi:hypothetical protein